MAGPIADNEEIYELAIKAPCKQCLRGLASIMCFPRTPDGKSAVAPEFDR